MVDDLHLLLFSFLQVGELLLQLINLMLLVRQNFFRVDPVVRLDLARLRAIPIVFKGRQADLVQLMPLSKLALTLLLPLFGFGKQWAGKNEWRQALRRLSNELGWLLLELFWVFRSSRYFIKQFIVQIDIIHGRFSQGLHLGILLRDEIAVCHRFVVGKSDHLLLCESYVFLNFVFIELWEKSFAFAQFLW